MKKDSRIAIYGIKTKEKSKMKLTEKRIKQIILEELTELTAQAPNEKTQSPDQQSDKKSSFTSSDLKKELIALGQKIQSVKGLDPMELQLVSGIIGTAVDIASKNSSSSALKRVYDMLEKFNAK